jgi:hypothetical protein
MPRFKILPTDQSYSSAQITALDAGAVLGIVDRLDCKEADVLQDDVYSFSVRLGSNGIWSIFQRADHALDTQALQSFG